MPFGPTHTTIRLLATYATQSFFSRIQVDGAEHVPKEEEGPILAVANHWNSAVDPAVMSCYFPHRRKLHYWAKSTLFKPGFARTVLLDAGNIPVDRKTKDNQKLFALTFDNLKHNECVAIFPEGGSYTMPGIKELKDGASWAALEYAKNVREKGRSISTGGEVGADPKDVTICIAGITYTDKSKYRSSVLITFGPSIRVEPYVEEFFVDPKSAVKKLTREIELAMTKVIINAPDWDSLHAATMTRRMLWVDEANLPILKFREVSQMLVDFFADAKPDSKKAALQALLLAYHHSLRLTHLTHYSLTGVPLPAALDPSIPHTLPTRFRVAFSLLFSASASLIRLPLFIVPLIVHLPIYLITKYSLRLSRMEEDHAQFKIALGLIFAILTYPTLFVFSWFVLFLTPIGGILALGFVWLFAVYHNTMIDDNYNAAKRLVASWRVVVGVWAGAIWRTEKSRGENEIRKVLRLRLETTQALMDFMLEQERNGGVEGEMVKTLLGNGAKITRPKKGATHGVTKIE